MQPAPHIFDRESAETRISADLGALRSQLKAYVYSILPHHAACDDVVQETCLFIWESRAECREDTNMKAWAFKVAWFKALAYRRDMQREKVVYFSEDVLHDIAGAAEETSNEVDARMLALRACLAKLPPDELKLLKLKYIERGSLTDHARKEGWKPNRVQKTLSRLRIVLRSCVESKLSQSP